MLRIVTVTEPCFEVHPKRKAEYFTHDLFGSGNLLTSGTPLKPATMPYVSTGASGVKDHVLSIVHLIVTLIILVLLNMGITRVCL